MSSISTLPASLSFLSWLEQDRDELYRTAWWLKSPFISNTWICDFGKANCFTICFDLLIVGGDNLCAAGHEDLLEVFKCWLCIQTHPDWTNGKTLGRETAFHAVSQVLRLIDYFLLNSERYSLSEHGLGNLTNSDICAVIYDLASAGNTASAIYDWPKRLQNYLRINSLIVTKEELDAVIRLKPSIAIIETPVEDRTLDLSEEELIRARVFLWKENLYGSSPRLSVDFRYRPSISGLVKLIYPNTLWAMRTNFGCPDELCVEAFERYYREFEGVPVRTSLDDQMSERGLTRWTATLESLGLLSAIKLNAPITAINTALIDGWLAELSLKQEGRFRTIPQDIVFALLKSSIEYAFLYGDDIIDSYVRLAKAAKDAGLTVGRYASTYGIRDCLTHRLNKCGVMTWHLGKSMTLSEANPARIGVDRAPAADYFRRLRANEGLYEMFCVLVGCVQICVGILTARRQAELVSLRADSCVDHDQLHLIFHNRKTGVAGLRNREARPIPQVASTLIKMLERCQSELIDAGCILKFSNIFATPHRSNHSFSTSVTSYNRCLDRAADYFNNPTDKHGKRYYPRQHQFRRFFASLFFWSKSFGGVDTLRWFLGHTDVRHLYHYITESTPGAALRSAKARYSAEELIRQGNEHDDLASILEEHFGTKRFSMLDADELEDYIAELIYRGTVTVEPYFLDGPDGTSYKVIISVVEK